MASKNSKMVDPESAGGSMTDASKRRGDHSEQPGGKGMGKDGPQRVISYNHDFDIQRLQHMVVALQGDHVLGAYPERPWETEVIGSLVSVPLVSSPLVQTPVVVSKAKAKPAARQTGHRDDPMEIPPDVREIMMDDARMREDYAEFARWHVVEEESRNIDDSFMAQPSYDVREIHLPQEVGSYEEWGDIFITMPQYRGLGVTFSDLYTQSFRDVSAESYARYITGRFSKFVPTGRRWVPDTQGPDLAGYLMASNWSAKLDASKASVAGGSGSSGRRGYRRTFRGCKP